MVWMNDRLDPDQQNLTDLDLHGFQKRVYTFFIYKKAWHLFFVYL